MKILFLSDNFPPEYNAPATRTYEHCKEWVKLGAKVTVITCFPNFPQGKIFEGYKNKLWEEEWIDGIRVIRVWSFISSNKGFFRRTIDFLSYAFMAFFAGLFIKTDIIIATSPQFFTAVSGYFLSVFKRKKWIMEVRDLWPESISAVNAVKGNIIIKWLEKLELFLYRNCARIVVVTDAFKKDMINRGIDGSKIFVVKNGANLSRFSPLPPNSEIKAKLNLNGSFVIGYIGTHGLAHSLEFIVTAISKMQNSKVKFLFIGDGAEKENVVSKAQALSVENVIFCPPVEKAKVRDYLSVIDAALVPLKKSDTFKCVIPSKIFESAAMGKPILLGVDGESRAIIEKYEAGLYFEPENEKDFIEKVKELVNQGDQEKFKNGCFKLASDFNREKLAKEMYSIVSGAAKNYK
ncbi:glycosyltransferase family 4 protein [Fulvivirga imtechensis]|uniref:glycosyltransferase family 4 protein n=1 Tax=Fulvivirga imtechensis TaxID=881893 RepID=UPI0005911443|nr:glycosyltransferase family 4 protein [Fulvivirga imtechensis]